MSADEVWSLPNELLLERRGRAWVVRFEAENPPGSGRVSTYAADVPSVLVPLLKELPGAEEVR